MEGYKSKYVGSNYCFDIQVVRLILICKASVKSEFSQHFGFLFWNLIVMFLFYKIRE